MVRVVLLGILLITFVAVLPNGIHGLLRRKAVHA